MHTPPTLEYPTTHFVHVFHPVGHVTQLAAQARHIPTVAETQAALQAVAVKLSEQVVAPVGQALQVTAGAVPEL